jgi:voltage-gated potassium channel
MDGAQRRDSLVRLPGSDRGPLAALAIRLAIALAVLTFVAMVAYLGRDGYVDAAEDEVSLLDAFYYATVSVTTTGYGDVRPESDSARLLSIVLITPARVLFLILLVGTTVEFLAGATRTAVRVRNWRGHLRDHVVICGYGTKGRMALVTLRGRGHEKDQVVVVDRSEEARERAHDDGLTVVGGDAASSDTLLAAGVDRARAVVVAASRDDAAVLITLTARHLNPTATIVASVREEDNARLLRQSGADTVITSMSAAGRLLGLATSAPRLAAVLEDLLEVGQGFDLEEREVSGAEAGRSIEDFADHQPILAVLREGKMLRFDHPDCSRLREGDRIVHLVGSGTEEVQAP